MKLAYLAAGAAGMYCGTCLHDNTLAATLMAKGHDVALIPTYTPLRTDEDDVSIDRVFYGAINVYLEQKSALFRHTPWLVDRMLNQRGLLNWASRHSTSVNARELGDLTLSVLEGPDGKQAKELERLIEWLKVLEPQLVMLTNSMFLGTAGPIRRALGVPVLCALQGEDIFLEDLPRSHRERVRGLLRTKAADASGFIAPSAYYVDHMSDYLDVDRKRIHHVPLGIRLDGHQEHRPGVERPFVVGYLARICPEKGLHLLVDAFRQLAQEMGRDQVRLRVAGYLGERDRGYFEAIKEQCRNWGLEGQLDWIGEVDRQAKLDFLHTIDALSVPTTYREPKGMFVLEALASGVPVVQPRHGAFPELIESTGGGLLVDADTAPPIAQGLRRLMEHPEECERLGRQGREIVHREYNDSVMADNTLAVYRQFLE